MSLDAEVWEVARRVCTPAELRALRKREDLSRSGEFTWRKLAEACQCSIPTVRSRVLAAEGKIQADGQVPVMMEEPTRCAEMGPLGRCELEAGHEGWCRVAWGPLV